MGIYEYDSENRDIKSYSDENIALYLQKLHERSLEDLMAEQLKIADEYANATKAYEAERTEIRWARRRYWMLIFVGVFQEIWRKIQGKTSKLSKLKQKKSDLKEQYQEQDQAYSEQLELVRDSIETIKLYSNEVSKRSKELAEVNEVIEILDTKLSEATDVEDQIEIELPLNQHIEDRDILNHYINELCTKSEMLINGLAGLLDHFTPDYIDKNFLSERREANAEKIAELRERCKDMTHPIIPKLLVFLTRKTATSLHALQAEIAKDKALFKDRKLGDVVWEANNLYPGIFLEKNRKQTLVDYFASQERELVTLQEVIEAIDVRLQANENPDTREMLDQLVLDRDKLTKEISHLLLLHRDILLGSHAQLLEQVHVLDRQNSDNALVKDVKQRCERIKHPVTQALHYFLTYRTDVGLKNLKALMDTDPTYFESREVIRLLDDAVKIDERVGEGWVKELELPSIKEIQDNYNHEIADKLQSLNEHYNSLTDRRVELSEELHTEEEAFADLDKQYTAIAGMSVRGYLPRAELHEIKKDKELFARYTTVREACKDSLDTINMLKKELKVVGEHIKAIEEEQEKSRIQPTEFTPELMQGLLKKCKQITRLGRVHPVASALATFLNYPTPSLLNKLQLAMQTYPEHNKNTDLLHLLNEANKYYPYIYREGAASPEVKKSTDLHFFQDPQTARKENEHSPKPRFGLSND